ncbi:PH domain-containing protein [Nocardia stercoris]|uniref:PH domain-containing protein n=1 Tax=Nocardia stercoris TaxID=2483361 RepID=A0A3M2LHG5_9NOCA|nr:PH domain-containing protein [Nocardia stercoris]RMI35455.1 PH domain-containing protein [Nocardia stercoris]
MNRLGHIGVFILLFCVAFAFFGNPAVLWVLFAIPLGAALWIERTRTVVSPAGLDLRTLRGSRHIDWDSIRGLYLPKRAFARVHLDDDTDVALPAVYYDRLPELIAASGGRIPDPFAAAAQAETDAEQASSDATATENPAGTETDGDHSETTN